MENHKQRWKSFTLKKVLIWLENWWKFRIFGQDFGVNLEYENDPCYVITYVISYAMIEIKTWDWGQKGELDLGLGQDLWSKDFRLYKPMGKLQRANAMTWF